MNTYAEFKKTYSEMLTRLMNYKPDTIGHEELAAACGELMDEYPEWTELAEIDFECEALAEWSHSH